MKNSLLRLHFTVFLWGFTGVLGKAITLNEGWLVWWRMFISAISIAVLYGFKGKIEKISFRDFFKIASIGTILSLHWLCFYGSIKYANVSIALTCLSTSGLISAFIEPLFFRRRINIAELSLGLFALAGIAIIYFDNLYFSTGIYVGLLSSVLTVLVSVMNKKYVTDFKPETVTLYQLSGGCFGLTVLLPLYDYIFHSTAQVPQGLDWLWLMILSWLCTILTFMIYIRVLKQVTAFTVNLTLTLEPVYGIVLAFLIYHENKSLGDKFYIGFGLILLAVIIQMLRLVQQHRKLPVNPLQS